ncbi:hypothetical protein BKM31_58425 [[Actinomadura] parvosata subsp. kistnae]|uniref:Uncharacterized protein n=2 Tax=Nonomuraea TaxID=83681 RepID=A0A1V0AIA9_9ACTN|nr:MULTISPECIES: hypothetical protein [unclassified Nonomuraea]AQZ69950.1 hypothetical protein BKM31_58425 [Nonomuraea sp. ATCC 55076]NJP93516.1 hypothetical protein [Nonomuraea sp. FMUSA5-5]
MPCYRCGARQTDPVRGASPWQRGVRNESQVLICPDCQRLHDLDLDACSTCASTALICRLGEVECRSCGAVWLARSSDALDRPAAVAPPPGLSAEVEAALNRVLGRA